jgi:hypothetical protein
MSFEPRTTPPEAPEAGLASPRRVGVPDALWAVHYRRGYEDGSRQLARDVLEGLTDESEPFVPEWAEAAAPPVLVRSVVYAFARRLERRMAAAGEHAP